LIDFWFSIGSTYTYLTVMRLVEVQRNIGIEFRWRLFPVRQLMNEQNKSPLHTKPVKMAYVWRDIERRAFMYGLPARVPAPYPLAEWDTANGVAVLAADRRMDRWLHTSHLPTLVSGRTTTGKRTKPFRKPQRNPPRSLAGDGFGGDARHRNRLRGGIGRVCDLGIFGSPTFRVGHDLFWDDERLNDAIAWYRRSTLEGP